MWLCLVTLGLRFLSSLLSNGSNSDECPAAGLLKRLDDVLPHGWMGHPVDLEIGRNQSGIWQVISQRRGPRVLPPVQRSDAPKPACGVAVASFGEDPARSSWREPPEAYLSVHACRAECLWREPLRPSSAVLLTLLSAAGGPLWAVAIGVAYFQKSTPKRAIQFSLASTLASETGGNCTEGSTSPVHPISLWKAPWLHVVLVTLLASNHLPMRDRLPAASDYEAHEWSLMSGVRAW